MQKLYTLYLLAVFVCGTVNGQYSLWNSIKKESVCSQKAGYSSRLHSSISSSSSTSDVTYYKLNLTVSVAPNLLKGVVTMQGVSLVDTLRVITLDLANAMTVDSVRMNGERVPFARGFNTCDVELDTTYRSGRVFALDVYYKGIPASTSFGSFLFSSHAGVPWVWSLSEPYGASDWWPCKNQLMDKADSVDIYVTCDALFKVGSNGRLVSVIDNGNGTKTHHWSERYPIATYLVSIALTNFAEFSNWYRYTPTDSMQILNYVLPEHLADAQAQLPKTVGMLEVFSEKFGLYPFISEKYGHAEFGRGGAMEHQTMTSTTSFDEKTIAHELAHQWFGDMITCANWSNLWLNEGFSRYCEAVYAEAMEGVEGYRDAMEYNLFRAQRAVGTLYVEDTTSVGNLFNGDRVYAKGACVLHMLRHVLGDSVFFQSMKAYATDPALQFKSATTEDFQRICETVSGRDLDFFFDEWVYGEKYPQYRFDWNAAPDGSGFAVTIRIDQTTNTSNPVFFTMPVDFRLSTGDWDTTVVLFNTYSGQEFTVRTTRSPTRVELDPENWILKEIITDIPLPVEYALGQNYPNPFNTGTIIPFHLPHRTYVRLAVYDILGRQVASLVDGVQEAGSELAEFSGSLNSGEELASGVYVYRLRAGYISLSRKMVVVR